MNSTTLSDNPDYYCGIDISNLSLIGEGRQGKVYLLPNDKVIKVFKSRSSCKDQLSILQKSSKSAFFPKVYDYDSCSIVMTFIKGIPLDKYIPNKGLNKNLSSRLVELINEFEKLGFTRLDIRVCHIFVQEDEEMKIIDPRRSFKIVQEYPLLMLRGLRRLGVLDDFFGFIRDDYSDKCSNWKTLWENYDNEM